MLSYRKDFQLWWPEWDKKAERNFEFIHKHLCDMDFAIKSCKKHDVVIQAGGHVGLWPLKLAKHFKTVYTFEADADLFQCLVSNTKEISQVVPRQYALVDRADHYKFHRSSSSGSNRLNELGSHIVAGATIDLMNLSDCDAILLDIEGGELNAIKGALETIEKFKPVIQIEWLKHYEPELQEIDRILKSLGYQDKVKSGRDMVYLHE